MSYARVELIQTCHHCVHIDLQSTIVVAVNLLLLFTISMESLVLFFIFFSALQTDTDPYCLTECLE